MLFLFAPNSGLTIAEERGLAARQDRPYFSPWNWDRYPGMHTGAEDNPFARYDRLMRVQRPPDIRYKDLQQLVDVNISYDTLSFRTRRDYFRLNEDSVLVPLTIELDNSNLTFRVEGERMVAPPGHLWF